jgi:hypothetical protein
MAPNEYAMPLKYAATLVSEFFIKNNMVLWESLCSNGIFDIWEPSEPHRRFSQARSNPANFGIQLLRIYEIDREFQPEDISFASSRIEKLVSIEAAVCVIAPVISDENFAKLGNLLRHSVKRYLTREPYIAETQDRAELSSKMPERYPVSLNDLTERKAVIAAIEEFDSLGRDMFLRKYGFRRARAYFFLFNNSRYDSKPIAGAALGIQHPENGPLRASDFSGGENTFAKKLRELGFDVISVSIQTEWTNEEFEAAVVVYFEMLNKELSGEPYNKTEYNRSHGRNVGYPTPPAQIPASGTTALGSCLGY